MKKYAIAAAVSGAMTAATLGFAGTAVASFDYTSQPAADAARALTAQGYSVQINGQPNAMPLSRCLVARVDGLTQPTVKPFGTVYINVSCPDTNN